MPADSLPKGEPPAPSAARPGFVASALRYGLAGLVNTVVGLAVTLATQFALGVDPRLANAAGIAVGLVVSFALNRAFVFAHSASPLRSGPKFALAVGLAFIANQAILWTLGDVRPARTIEAAAIQALAMAAYSLTLFLLSRYWVFANEPDTADGARS